MASFMSRFRFLIDAIKRRVAKPQRRGDAVFILEDVDRYWNLHTSVAITSFFVSAGLSVLAFFLINESVLSVGTAKPVALLLVSVSWALIFPIWALMFLVIMSALYAVGVMDLRSVVRCRLSDLMLSREQLQELQNTLASRHWRHGRLFKTVVADLTKEQMQF